MFIGGATLGLSVSTAFAETITVNADDPRVDTATIQAALNTSESEAKKLTVDLVGTFQLGGQALRIQRSNVTVSGRGTDENGNWLTVLKGVAGESGLPELAEEGFNRAFEVRAVQDELRNVAIEGIKFQDFYRAIDLVPERGFGGPWGATNGVVKDLRVSRNFFLNCSRGLQMVGGFDGVSAAGNRFLNEIDCDPKTMTLASLVQIACQRSIFVFGRRPEGSVILRSPRELWITNNRATGVLLSAFNAQSGVGFEMWYGEDVTVAGNHYDTVSDGVFVTGGSRVAVRENHVKDSFSGVRIQRRSPGSRIQGNTILRCVVPIILESGAQEFFVAQNRLEPNFMLLHASRFFERDISHNTIITAGTQIQLDGSSFFFEESGETLLNSADRNKIICTDCCTGVEVLTRWTVELSGRRTFIGFAEGPLGTFFENDMLGAFAMTSTPGISPEVRERFEELREPLAEKDWGGAPEL